MYLLKLLVLFGTILNAEAAKDEYSKEKCPSGAVAEGKGPPKDFERVCKLGGGRKNGPAASWFSDGQISEHGWWHLDKKHGLWETWYEDGVQKTACNYAMGVTDGVCATWLSSGQQETSVSFQSGLRNGESKVWYESGSLLESGVYVDDRLGGLWTEFYPNGNKRYQAEYLEGMRQGFWHAFNMAGIVVEKGGYDSDWKSGLWQYYYDDGSLKQSGQFRNDLRIGEWLEYHKGDKKLRAKGSYIRDREEGSWSYYDESGTVIRYAEYKAGEEVVSVMVGKGTVNFQISCADGAELVPSGDSFLGWPRVLASEFDDEDLAPLLEGGWVYDLSGDFAVEIEIMRSGCLRTACELTRDPGMCSEIEAVSKYLSARLRDLGTTSEADGYEAHKLIQLGQLEPEDEAGVIPALSWLSRALPGERVAFGELTGGEVAVMAGEHALAQNLVEKDWFEYLEKVVQPSCMDFVEATEGEESLWPEVFSAKDLWLVDDEMVRTVLTPPTANRDIRNADDLPALNLRNELPDWIRSWPLSSPRDRDEINREVRDHARLLRSVVVLSVCADTLGSTFATKYLKSAYAKYRNPDTDGWGFVRLVDLVLERQPESERTILGLWRIHWLWAKENGQMAKLPDYIDRATQWLGSDWRSTALEGLDLVDLSTVCASARFPDMCTLKWEQLKAHESAQAGAVRAPPAELTLTTGAPASIRCSGESVAFDGQVVLRVEGYQLPATCLLVIGGKKQVFQVFGSGEITCGTDNTGVVCDRDVVP